MVEVGTVRSIHCETTAFNLNDSKVHQPRMWSCPPNHLHWYKIEEFYVWPHSTNQGFSSHPALHWLRSASILPVFVPSVSKVSKVLAIHACVTMQHKVNALYCIVNISPSAYVSGGNRRFFTRMSSKTWTGGHMAGNGTGGILHSKILAKPLIAHEGKGLGQSASNCMH